jgi:AraC-like DNA-binding protein
VRTGQPDSAIGILEEGIRFVREKNVPTYRHKLYRSLSEAYRSVGQLDKALDCYMVFHTESESLFDLERERSVNELRIAYESQMTENEHSRADRRVVVWIVSGVVVLISMVGFSFFVFRRHRKKHRASGSADERERGREIFRRLEEKMQAEGLYRDGSLTANKLAESLGTNRSYLSRAINDFAGGSFYDYVYSYRVDEAVRILTDGDNDEPLKSIAARTGFGSLNTFYVKFRQKMGTTPSEFRANRRG